MKTTSITKILLTLILAFSVGIVKSQVRVLTGFEGATYYQMAKEMQKLCPPILKADTITKTVQVYAHDDKGQRIKGEHGNFEMVDSSVYTLRYDTVPFIKILTSDGAYYNFLKIDNVDVDIVFMQYDVLLSEDLKDLKRKFKKTADVRILLTLGAEQIHLVTRKDSKLTGLADLKGKTVAVGSSMQGTYVTAQLIKEKTGIQWNDAEIPFDKAFRALMNKDIDAFFFVGAAPVQSLNKLSPTLKDQIKLLPVSHKNLDAIYEKATITAGTYNWVDKDIQTYSVKSVLACSVKNESPKSVENIDKLLSAIRSNLARLQETGHPAWKQVNFQANGIEWEFHPVAKKYMK